MMLLLIATILLPLMMGCGDSKSHLSEYQEWIDINTSIRDMMNVYTEAFFREYQKMPSSLEELQSSEWYWLDPVGPKFTDNFELVDRELGSYDDDSDKIQVSFTETGITYVYYYRDSAEGGQPHKYTGLTRGDAKSTYENNIQADINSAMFDVTNMKYVRQNLMYGIARLLVRRYVEFYRAAPSKPRDLFANRWEPRTEIFGMLNSLPPNGVYSAYTGITIVDNEAVLFIELMQPNGEPFTEQRVYNIQVTGNTSSVVETFLEEEKHVERDETEPIFDSSLTGWGIS